MVTVCTLLPRAERAGVDAAGRGYFTTLHGDSVRDVLSAARRRRVDALVLSVHCGGGLELRDVAGFVREFPAIPAVALVSRHDRAAQEGLLRLGAAGIRAVVDCTDPEGWRRLRDLVGHGPSPGAARILGALLPALAGASTDVRLFFDALVQLAPVIKTVSGLARHLELTPSALLSRFYRAQLPSPKTYLTSVRLLHAAYLFDCCDRSIPAVAYRLDYSTPKMFRRHVKAQLGACADEFRRRFPFDVVVARFIAELITPYQERLSTFHPLAKLGDQGPVLLWSRPPALRGP